jgi:hypothetical protein
MQMDARILLDKPGLLPLAVLLLLHALRLLVRVFFLYLFRLGMKL